MRAQHRDGCENVGERAGTRPSRRAIGGASTTRRSTGSQPGNHRRSSSFPTGRTSGLPGLRRKKSNHRIMPSGATTRSISLAMSIATCSSSTELKRVEQIATSIERSGTGSARGVARRRSRAPAPAHAPPTAGPHCTSTPTTVAAPGAPPIAPRHPCRTPPPGRSRCPTPSRQALPPDVGALPRPERSGRAAPGRIATGHHGARRRRGPARVRRPRGRSAAPTATIVRQVGRAPTGETRALRTHDATALGAGAVPTADASGTARRIRCSITLTGRRSTKRCTSDAATSTSIQGVACSHVPGVHCELHREHVVAVDLGRVGALQELGLPLVDEQLCRSGDPRSRLQHRAPSGRRRRRPARASRVVGPSSAMRPVTTSSSCGSSSMRNRRIVRPIAVTRGSSPDVIRAPSASPRPSSARMVRSLCIPKHAPFRPTRVAAPPTRGPDRHAGYARPGRRRPAPGRCRAPPRRDGRVARGDGASHSRDETPTHRAATPRARRRPDRRRHPTGPGGAAG